MAFGSIYVKDTYGGFIGWHQGQLYVKTATGTWKPVNNLYEKTGPTTWTEKFNADLTPPGVATYTSAAHNATTRTYTLGVRLAADADVAGGCLKLSKTAYPTNPGVLDANCFTNTQTDGKPFWNWTGAPNSTSTRVTPALTSNTKYYVSAWTRDASGNWSAPAYSITVTPLPPAPTKVLKTFSAYVETTDSASWRSAYGWRTDNNYVYQGGDYNYQGFWFYSTKIATLLKSANAVTKIEIYIQRNSGAHGIAGDGNIMVGHHTLATQPSGSPGTNAVQGEYNMVDLGRGEGKWVTVTSSWYSAFKSGAYKGFGTMYQTTSNTSSYYNQCYGKGTSSGKLRITYNQYV